MAMEEIALKQGRQRHLDVGAIGVVRVREGQDGGLPEVVVSVESDNEHDFTLHPGDTFPFGDQTWKLDRVKGPGGHDLTAVFARIE
ncbi:DUF6406 domain-containing protein [Actinomadura sp. 7K507]|uniref:DUF6406 domain-containing protein n=1 Tax=Actinomadura sp. 7K507 TaxID=2530365 RepID=UPI001050C760|nr:DUF6406 domain-containing protein [Actinomadura sp. 7K507]TDC82574.1 hypothetical protein E1285_30500 [Actinomadura sp. 7K507]